MKRIIGILLLLLLLPALALADFEAHFLDVGHGDCIIILCDGEAMVIDGGEAGESDRVFATLRKLGVEEIKYVVATHPQSDHVGGLPAVFHAGKVHALYSPVETYDNERFQTLVDKAKEQSVPLVVPSAGDVLTLGGAKLTVLAPIKPYKDPNDVSIVLRADYGMHSFLFCGDAGQAVEKTLLKAHAKLDVDVLKVAHHGSSSATSQAFVEAVTPRYAVISCSARYDNPDGEVLDALHQTEECDVLRTDVNGEIVIASNGLELTVMTERHYVGNANSKVFHRMHCGSVTRMKEANKVLLYTPDQAEAEGFRPCKNCTP